MTATPHERQSTGSNWIAPSETGPRAEDVLCFSSFRLDVRNQELWREDRLIKLMPKTFDVLRYFVEHPQRLVTKRELLNAVWSGVVVSEAIIKAHVREIRRSLGDTSTPPSLVETLHRRGYRFLCRVERVAPAQSAQPEAIPSAPGLALRTDVVGRDEQIRELAAGLEEAQHFQSRVVFVTGEAGIGKTTVVNAFLASHCSDSELWLASGQCIEQYGSGSAYLPFLEALRLLCTERHSAVVLDVFRRHAPDWLGQLPEGLAPAAGSPAVARRTSATPERLLRQMAEAVAALTALRPLVLVLEDLQWVDPSTLNLLSYLAQRCSSSRLLIVGTYRSGDVRLTEHPLWALHQLLRSRELCKELALGKLEPAEVAGYLACQFPRQRFPLDLAPKIFQITSGNPLFMVRVVDGLVRRGVIREQDGYWTLEGDARGVDARLPDSVLSIITWELERVAQSERKVLEAASVAGLEFTVQGVASALGRDPVEVEQICNRWLRQGRFLEPMPLGDADEPGPELRYRFSHALYQQVLYAQLGPLRRAQLHGFWGAHLEATHLSLPQPVATSLAMHFARSGDQERAVRYGFLAGEHALRQGAYSEAIFHFQSALELLERTPEYLDRDRQELTILLALRVPLVATLGYAAAEVESLYARAAHKCLGMANTESFAVQAGVSVFQLVRGRPRDALDAARRCLALAGSNDDLRLDAELAAGVASFYCGEFAAAAAYFEPALARQLPAFPQRRSRYHQDADLLAPFYSCYLLWYAGEPASAQAKALAILRRARESGDAFTIAVAVQNLAALQCYCRDGALLARCAAELAGLCAEQDFAFYSGIAAAHRGLAALYLGDLEAGIRGLDEAWQTLKAAGSEIGGTLWCAELALAHGAAGDVEAGFRTLREGFEILHARGERYWEPELYRVHGELCARVSDGAAQGRSACGLGFEPEASFQLALTCAQGMGARPLELRAAASLARWRGGMQGGKELEPRSTR